jgi:phosphate transport system substrate-binding protein
VANFWNQTIDLEENAVKMNSRYSATCCTLALIGSLALPSASLASEVTLKSSDGTVNLVGEFVDFKDDNYIIRTALGDLRISASRVRCEGDACPDIGGTEAGVRISGADAIGLGLMPLLMTGYASSIDADAEIVNTAQGEALAKIVADGGFGDDLGAYLVSSTTSEQAFRALLDGEVEIGMSDRRIVPAEAKQLRASGAGNMVSPDQERIIAVDSLIVVTHPSNPVQQLTIEQLRDIYAGRITNWSQLGGENAEINVVALAEDSDAHNFFVDRVFGEGGAAYRDYSVAEDYQVAAAMVNKDKNAIGYVGYAFQRGAKPVTLVNECGIPTRPDAFSAKTEEYALNRRMYLYNRIDNLSEASKQFLEFATSEDADGVIAKSGFIDLGIARRSQDLTDARALELINAAADDFEAGVMREMLAAMIRSDRLSTTFRFRPGSSKMDEKALLDMERLINYLEEFPDGTGITLVGFTDDVGAFESNRTLSMQRASQVREDLLAAAGDRLDGITVNAIGFGEIAPSACNVTEQGRGINRRVEVWIDKNAAS